MPDAELSMYSKFSAIALPRSISLIFDQEGHLPGGELCDAKKDRLSLRKKANGEKVKKRRPRVQQQGKEQTDLPLTRWVEMCRVSLPTS